MQEPTDYPRTVDDAVQFVLARMPAELKADLCDIEDEVDAYVRIAQGHFGFNLGLRNALGLWGKNPELIAALPRLYKHADMASSYLLLECWRILRRPATP